MNSLTTVFLSVDIFVVSGCKSRETKFSLTTSGVPGRVCWSADHLLNVLLPPSLHLFTEIWLYQQQALGCTVSVTLFLCSGICCDVTAMQYTIPGFVQMSPSTSQTLVEHTVWWHWGDGLRRASALITAKYVMCDVVCRCSLACMCHSLHYIKRILETVFVHRISHGTMPLRNIFKVSEWHNFDLWMCYLLIFLIW